MTTDDILSVLRGKGPQTTCQLAQRLGADDDRVTEICEDLEVQGVVEGQTHGETMLWRAA